MDNPDYLRFLLALILVLALLYGCLWLLQRVAPHLGGFHKTPRLRRLKMVESLILDPRRRLVLVQRDDKEYLILCGVNQDTVIEGAQLFADGPEQDNR